VNQTEGLMAWPGFNRFKCRESGARPQRVRAAFLFPAAKRFLRAQQIVNKPLPPVRLNFILAKYPYNMKAPKKSGGNGEKQ
jgi:hypothetical protein